jgi:hypothetical protein
VEDDARWGGFTIGNNVTRHLVEDPVHHTDLEMHMLVEAGAKAVNERHRTDVQCAFVKSRRTILSGSFRFQTRAKKWRSMVRKRTDEVASIKYASVLSKQLLACDANRSLY